MPHALGDARSRSSAPVEGRGPGPQVRAAGALTVASGAPAPPAPPLRLPRTLGSGTAAVFGSSGARAGAGKHVPGRVSTGGVAGTGRRRPGRSRCWALGRRGAGAGRAASGDWRSRGRSGAGGGCVSGPKREARGGPARSPHASLGSDPSAGLESSHRGEGGGRRTAHGDLGCGDCSGPGGALPGNSGKIPRPWQGGGSLAKEMPAFLVAFSSERGGRNGCRRDSLYCGSVPGILQPCLSLALPQGPWVGS